MGRPPIEISTEDYLQILHPERRDPAVEAKRRATIRRSEQLGPLTPEALARGIPIRPKSTKSTSR